ncbi:MAG: leucine-rich repeat domain-containing protein, partial [Bacillus sp. (in: firmicutes)]
VEIPDTIDGKIVTAIGNQAFYNCSNITCVTFGEDSQLTSIGDYAFYSCKNLTSIEIPNSVESIREYAFVDCTSLESVTFGKNSQLTSIGDYAFYYCEKLNSIEIPYSVKSIGGLAFCKMDDYSNIYAQLDTIFLPDNGLTIGDCVIFNTTTQVKYSLDTEKGEVTIIGIELGTGKSCEAIPATICGYPVVAVAASEQDKVGAHTCKGGTATCTAKALCAICGEEYGELANHSLSKTEAKDPTCTEDGNTVYWTCSVCHKLFSDEDGTNETTLDAVTIKAAHKLTKTEAKAATCTEDGNTAYWTCSVCHKLFSDEDGTNETTLDAVTIKAGHTLTKTEAQAATVTETGNIEYWHCKDCGKYFADENGTDEITLDDTVIAKLPPEIIKGKGQTVTAGEKKALSFTSNAAFSDFIRVDLDGETLDTEYYTAESGSIIVTLDADYVATIPVGEHTIGIVSTSGTAETTFTVAKNAAPADVDGDKKSPQTGDNTDLAPWIALMILSGAGITGVTAYTRRKRTNE